MKKLQWHLSTLILFILVVSGSLFVNLRPKNTYTFERRPEGIVSGSMTQGFPCTFRRIDRILRYWGEDDFEEQWFGFYLFIDVLVSLCIFLLVRFIFDRISSTSRRV